MYLEPKLIETINETWESLSGYTTITKVTIHPSLAECISIEGYEVPTHFDPTNYNSLEENHSKIPIVVAEQPTLIQYEYSDNQECPDCNNTGIQDKKFCNCEVGITESLMGVSAEADRILTEDKQIP